ncbi:hypothetical protein [Oscillibacter sp.]|uniref:hypothetical protein n=1 Tax=Oscillibacter sp. TaxID=1945593 RepID=UPI0028AF5214|nr:hypothetical protein [Oscillibacter sp.]
MVKKEIRRNTEGLKICADRKRCETVARVNTAIDRLKRAKNKSINFSTVAVEAGVSKATLYNHPILKERIMSLRAAKKLPEGHCGMGSEQKDKNRQLRLKIQRLQKDKENLILQLLELEALKGENHRLREQLSRIQQQSTCSIQKPGRHLSRKESGMIIDENYVQQLRESTFREISAKAEEEILKQFGGQRIGDLFTEQDIYEQIRKILATC